MKIEWRQLLIVAVVAVVFGGSAGYLGGRYSGGTGDTQIITPRYSSAPVQGQTESFRPLGDSDAERLERRLKCIESQAQQNLEHAMNPSLFQRERAEYAPCY